MSAIPPSFNEVMTATNLVHHNPNPKDGEPRWFFRRGKLNKTVKLNGQACSAMLKQGRLVFFGRDRKGFDVYTIKNNPFRK